MENFTERLRSYFHYKKLKVSQVAVLLGYSHSEKLSRLFRKKPAAPSLSIVQDIANKFEDLNVQWLITGKGHMLTPQYGINKEPLNDAAKEQINTAKTAFLKKLPSDLDQLSRTLKVKEPARLALKMLIDTQATSNSILKLLINEFSDGDENIKHQYQNLFAENKNEEIKKIKEELYADYGYIPPDLYGN